MEIFNGDCMQILQQIPDKSINTIITSPPYNKGFFTKQKKTNQIWNNFKINYSTYMDNLPLDKYEQWMIEFINLCLMKLVPHGSFFFNHKPIRYKNSVYHPLAFILKSNAVLYQEIIWDRHNSPNIRNDCLVPCTERIYWLTNDKPTTYRNQLSKEYISEVWNIQAKKNSNHPAPFPIELPTNCIMLTTQKGDMVLDPFMGIGTTLQACQNTKRDFIGIELDENYFNYVKNEILES